MRGARVVASTAFLALVLALAAAPALGAQAGGWERTCRVYIVAVSSKGGGVLGNLTVTVKYPGEGRVYISTSPVSLVDTQGSARLAAFAASILAGADMSQYDFYYAIESRSAIVGGPSAGAAMALATLYILTGVPCPRGVVATGMIQPDTSIGPVGGLKEKLEAAARGGASKFLIPAGQQVYTYYEEKVEKVGPFTVVTREPVTVNLTELGEELGVQVVPVATLAQAFEEATGRGAPVLLGAPPARLEPPTWVVYMLEWFVNRTVALVEDTASSVDGGRSAGPAREALDLAGEARGLAGAGRAYAAAVKAVEALAKAYEALYLNETLEAGFNATAAVADVNETIMRVWGWAAGNRSLEVYRLEALTKAYSKLGIAASTFEDALRALQEEDGSYYLPHLLFAYDDTGVKLLAHAKALAVWAGFWVNLSASAPPSPRVPEWRLERLASILVSEARTTAVYVDQLLSEAGGDEGLARLPISLAERALNADYPEEAIGYSIESIALATAAIHETFTLATLETSDQLLETAAGIAAPVESYAVQTALLASLARNSTGVERLEAASRAVLYAWLAWELASTAPPTPPPTTSTQTAGTATTTAPAATATPGATTTPAGTPAQAATTTEAQEARAETGALAALAGLAAGVVVGAALGLLAGRRR